MVTAHLRIQGGKTGFYNTISAASVLRCKAYKFNRYRRHKSLQWEVTEVIGKCAIDNCVPEVFKIPIASPPELVAPINKKTKRTKLIFFQIRTKSSNNDIVLE
ncbi:hypothetical protein CEXT_236721 [Caerostris extrusa]|uniref:Uncharacterized protein n=1 Tax=Caerostris extrusa TaxID=172846 RepID=A0AAV4PY93_CAEEX|nr:hypothetical protein CEXT_236721 [Caerostris extrusa]